MSDELKDEVESLKKEFQAWKIKYMSDMIDVKKLLGEVVKNTSPVTYDIADLVPDVL